MASVSSTQVLERGRFLHRPYVQLSVLGLMFLVCPEMFEVFLGLPNVFPSDTFQLFLTIEATGSLAATITNSIVAFFAGVIVNVFGPCTSLFIGGLGYTLYIASFWAVYKNSTVYKFIIAAEGIQGACAGVLWTAQGAIMLAYPVFDRKGLVISLFWSIFHLGALISSAIDFSGALQGVLFPGYPGTLPGIYPGFFVITLVGASFALLIVNPTKVVRADGSRVMMPQQSSWKAACCSIYFAVKTDPMVLLLFPMFFTSGYSLVWQQVNFNELLFSTPANELNTLSFSVAQMVGSVFLGFGILDRSSVSRRVRAFAGCAIVFGFVFLVHIWAYFFQRSPPTTYYAGPFQLDYKDPTYVAYLWLYIFYGLMDAMWNTLIYWLLGAISDDIFKLAVFVGFYQGLQVAGYAAGARETAYSFPSFIGPLASSWVLCAGSVLLAVPMVYYRITGREDSDEGSRSKV